MSVILQGPQQTSILFGNTATKSTGTLAATTVTLFNITGGVVALTAIYGEVTTSITVANSYKLQANPTTGVTGNLVAATDIGTADTLAGGLLSFDGVAASSIQQGIGTVPMLLRPIAVNTGTIESVSAGTDGVIVWTVLWVPITVGAALAAA